MKLVPIDLREANDFVERHHRHSKRVIGYKWAVSVQENGQILGVAIAGRPLARMLDDGLTIEILRVCTEGARNACSKLYASCCRSAKGMGYKRAITYTLESELGSSLRAAGFVPAAKVSDRQWGWAGRPREERDLVGGRVRWERAL